MGVAETSVETPSPALTLKTPPPKKSVMPDTSAEKSVHRMYKSRTCGNFCWDCKVMSPDLNYLRSLPCIPSEFKVEPGESEEVRTPRKGEAESIRSQVEAAEKVKEERAAKLKLFNQLQAEEIRLGFLLAKKRARVEPKVESTLGCIPFLIPFLHSHPQILF